MSEAEFTTLKLSTDKAVGAITLNRPKVRNAINMQLWQELHDAIDILDSDKTINVILFAAEGEHFSAGIDLSVLVELAANAGSGDIKVELAERIEFFQSVALKFALCSKPIISVIQGACIGAGLDLVSVTDIRFCSSDANFCLKEVDLGIVPDVGSLQWLTQLIPSGQLREMAYSAKTIDAEEAHRIGLVNTVFESHEELLKGTKELAHVIANKSPTAIAGIKQTLDKATIDTYREGLNFAAKYNVEQIQLNALAALLKR